MIARIHDTNTGDVAWGFTDEGAADAVRELFPESDGDVAEMVEAFLDGDTEAGPALGVEVEELDPDDHEEVSDELWGQWLIEQLDARGRRFEPIGGGGLWITLPEVPRGGAPLGGQVEVRAHTASNEHAQIKVAGWGDLRAAVERRREEEHEALAEVEQAKRRESARFDAIRAANRAVRDAESALARARAARATTARKYVEDGASAYRLAQECNVTPQAVAKWIA